MKRSVSASVVIASRSGRLGNRLFLSAYFMANALATGYQLLNPALGEYAHLFEGSAADPLCRFPSVGISLEPEIASQCRNFVLRSAEAIGSLAGVMGVPGITAIDIRKSHDAKDLVYDLCSDEFGNALHSYRNIFVKGWKFRDNEHLVKFHAEISNYFTPVDVIRQSAEKVMTQARERGEKVIGVHVRQGDYRAWKNGAHYYETEQYAHWMHEATALFPDEKIVLLVCASDPIDRRLFAGLNVVESPGSVIGDLHALSLCDVIIGPPSTFSTWASYIGRTPFCMLRHHRQKIATPDFLLHDRA